MYLKKFYLNPTLNIEKTINKKFLAENVYSKFLLRSKILINKNILFLDNGKSFFHIKQKTFQNLLNIADSNSLIGRAFRVKNTIYTSSRHKEVKFNYFSLYNNRKVSFIEKLNQLFYQFKNKKLVSVVFLEPVKGGFSCYFLGMICFVHRGAINNFLILKKVVDLKKIIYNSNINENFIYYPWYLSYLKLKLYYNKKSNLKNSNKKLYRLDFVLVNLKKQLKKKK